MSLHEDELNKQCNYMFINNVKMEEKGAVSNKISDRKTWSRKYTCITEQTSEPSEISMFKLNGELSNHENVHTDSKYYCKSCDKEFSLKVTFDLHMIDHSDGFSDSYFCDLCGQNCYDLKSVSEHIKRHIHINNEKIHVGQEEKRIFECLYCLKILSNEKQLKAHVRRLHFHSQLHHCVCCDMKFENKLDLMLHKLVHEKERKYKCGVCFRRFKRRGSLNIHYRIHTGDKAGTCTFCNKDFTQTGGLNMHMRIHTVTERNFVCLICSACFSYKSSLDTHMKTHSNRKQHFCPICQKGFSRPTCVKQHLRVHSNDKNFSCDICFRKFRYKSQLTSHRYIHTGDRPLQTCHICGKQMRGRSLQTHLERIHTVTVKLPCDLCKRVFQSQSALDKHKPIHDNKCSVCSGYFRKKKDLTQHMKRHDPANRYKCSLCSRQFVEMRSLEAHMNIHVGMKPFSCKLCNKDFVARSYLRRHEIQKHKLRVAGVAT